MGNSTDTPKSYIDHQRITTTPEIRAMVVARYPKTKDDVTLMRFLHFYLYSEFRDTLTGQLVIKQRTLAEIEKKVAALESGNYCAASFLERISQTLSPLIHSGWSYADKHARVIESFTIDPEIVLAVAADRSAPWKTNDRVYFVTGAKFTRKTKDKMRYEDLTYALIFRANAGCREAGILLDYMNSLPSHRFTTATTQHYDEAVSVASKLRYDPEHPNDPEKSPAVTQLNMLLYIRSQPEPFYIPSASGRTVRIFPVGVTIANLQGDVRAVLCQDWTGVDLRSAQLAICAKLWDVKPVMEFLGNGGSIWESLFAHFSIEPNGEVKMVFKKATYSTLYGAGKKTVVAQFIKAGMTEADAEHFLAHPLIAAMWEARKARLKQVRDDNGAYDCFGNWIKLPWDVKKVMDKETDKKINRKGPNAPSVLAQLAQAEELRLMFPIVELANTTDEFQIVLWLHDGCYLDFKDASKKDRWLKRIQAAVNEQAKSLGIPTQLELK